VNVVKYMEEVKRAEELEKKRRRRSRMMLAIVSTRPAPMAIGKISTKP